MAQLAGRLRGATRPRLCPLAPWPPPLPLLPGAGRPSTGTAPAPATRSVGRRQAGQIGAFGRPAGQVLQVPLQSSRCLYIFSPVIDEPLICRPARCRRRRSAIRKPTTTTAATSRTGKPPAAFFIKNPLISARPLARPFGRRRLVSTFTAGSSVGAAAAAAANGRPASVAAMANRSAADYSGARSIDDQTNNNSRLSRCWRRRR